MTQTDKKNMKLKKSVVSVALATDSNYIAPTLVAIKSIVLKSSENYDYSIYVLSDKPLSVVEKRLLLSLTRKRANIHILFITVGDKIGSVQLSNNGFTKGITQATYFRFLLPSLLKDQDKIIYMDADAIALDDIGKIYSYNLEGCYVGGARDIVGYQDKENRCKELQIDDLDQYVNAGVLLMDLKKWRENALAETMLEMAAKQSFTYNDQDIINSVCYGKIKCLPCKCNAIVEYLNDPQQISKQLGIDYSEECKKPIILHYAGRAKPWYSKKGRYAPLWWEIADSFNSFISIIIKYSVRKLRLKSQKNN